MRQPNRGADADQPADQTTSDPAQRPTGQPWWLTGGRAEADNAAQNEQIPQTGQLPQAGSDTRRTRGRDQTADSLVPPSWFRSVRELDIFWPILAGVLVLAVVFVASVAHSSMNGVGAATAVSEPPPPPTTSQTPAPEPSASTVLVVQVSSHPNRPDAEVAAAQLTGQGFAVHILDSDDYRPLNRGFFVVYTGPYPRTSAGRAAARKIQAKLPGALVRDLHRR